jgi:hypothetical protein
MHIGVTVRRLDRLNAGLFCANLPPTTVLSPDARSRFGSHASGLAASDPVVRYTVQ